MKEFLRILLLKMILEAENGDDHADEIEQIQLIEHRWEEAENGVSLPRVTYLQFKPAKYICTSCRNSRGLSVKETTAYLKPLDSKGEVRTLWGHGTSFWKDHGRRQKAKLDEFGK